MTEKEKKLFGFRTDNDKIISFLSTKKEVNSYLLDLVFKDMRGELSSDTKRLKDLKLTLDCWKVLKDLGIVIPKINNAFDVISGKEKIPIPPIEILSQGNSETSQQSFLDDQLHCSKCQHQHMTFNRNCSKWDCDCEIRT